MISVIVYGRNDAHGYNLHKRAAISLNCIAEVLSDRDDEVIFVDYNTPDDLPTFIEAIYDTLTPRTKSLLRVLRVRPHIHKRFGVRTHLSTLEAHARNIAIRRSNPKNRWVLLTNTDMILVPVDGASDLDGIVRGLPDGYHGLPRYELPESLWESFPRQDPVAVMRDCDRLGQALHLHDVTASHPYLLFDAPGDFQLIPRQAVFDIHGLDERMIHGWHIDSNLCKRLFLLYGRVWSLEDRLRGYHCDHTRVGTLMHRQDIHLENDLNQFLFSVTDPYAAHQATSWGIPGEAVEEIDFRSGPQARYAWAVERSLGAPQATVYHSSHLDLRNYVFYHPEHVLPYIAADLTVYSRDARFLYVGNNPRLLGLLAACVSNMGFSHPVHYLPDVVSRSSRLPDGIPPAPPAGARRDWAAGYALLIFDFGLDEAGLAGKEVLRVTDWPRELRYSLGAVARHLEACAESCDETRRSSPGRALADFLVINGNPPFFDQFTSQFLLTTRTQYNTRVRRGRARLGDERLYKSHRWKDIEEAMRAFFGYDATDDSVPAIGMGQTIDLTTLGHSSAYKDGHWGYMDPSGSWTDGARADILFRADASIHGDLVARVHVSSAFIGPDGDPVRVNAQLQGETLERLVFSSQHTDSTFNLLLPFRLLSGAQPVRLSFLVENPQSPAEGPLREGRAVMGEDLIKELGIKVHSITFTATDRLRYSLGDTISFRSGRGGLFYTDHLWSTPDEYGTWTIGPDAGLLMYLSEFPEEPLAALFQISDAAVSEAFPQLTVAVSFNGEHVADWVLGPARIVQTRRIVVSSQLLKRQQPLRISFHVNTPRSPAQLDWSTDTRLLGLRLTEFRMVPRNVPVYRLGAQIDFREGGDGQKFLDDNWAPSDRYGCWTVGPRAGITFRPDRPPSRPIPASFLISDCMVDAAAPTLRVQLDLNGQALEEWVLGPDRGVNLRTVWLPPRHLAPDQDVTISFRIQDPRSPASFGWSSDPRPLGIRLTAVAIGSNRRPVGGTVRRARVFMAAMRARAGRLARRLRRGVIWLYRRRDAW
jgi:hypothetical protein